MNTKGFAGVLFVLAVFIATIMLLGVNNITLNQPSYKEMLTESKLVINNYELNLLQMTKDCNWEKSEAELRNCVDQNSTTLLNKINSNQSSTTCTRNNFSSSGKSFTIDLNCITKAEGKKAYLTINASKIINVGTPPASVTRKELSSADTLFDANLVGLWHLNNDGLDSSGKGNNAAGMLVSSATDRFGNLNSAYQFNGTNSFIKMNASSSLNLKNKLTMIVWIMPQGTLPQPILEYNNGTVYGVHLWQFNTFDTLFTNLVATTPPNHSISAPGQIIANTWQQVGVTYDGKNYKLYKNGNLLVTSAAEIFTPQTTYDFYIGKRLAPCYTGISCYFTGTLDEVAIWDRNLSAAEMLALYNSQK